MTWLPPSMLPLPGDSAYEDWAFVLVSQHIYLGRAGYFEDVIRKVWMDPIEASFKTEDGHWFTHSELLKQIHEWMPVTRPKEAHQ